MTRIPPANENKKIHVEFYNKCEDLLELHIENTRITHKPQYGSCYIIGERPVCCNCLVAKIQPAYEPFLNVGSQERLDKATFAVPEYTKLNKYTCQTFIETMIFKIRRTPIDSYLCHQ